MFKTVFYLSKNPFTGLSQDYISPNKKTSMFVMFLGYFWEVSGRFWGCFGETLGEVWGVFLDIFWGIWENFGEVFKGKKGIKNLYAHIKVVVAFLVVNFFGLFVITRHHGLGSGRN